MTNYNFLKNSSIDEMSEIITALLVQTLEQAGFSEFPMEVIKKEKLLVRSWLNQEIVSGEYLN